MPFVVESGGGDADANAYISVEYADDFHTLRGNSTWVEAGDPDKKEAIIRATDYIDKRFGRLFLGQRMESAQGLEWPRIDAIDYDGFLLNYVPSKLQRATAEYALRALIYIVLAPDPPKPVPTQSFASGSSQGSSQTGSGEITYKRSKVGSLETEVHFQPVSNSNSSSSRQSVSGIVNDWQIPAYPEADMWIEALLIDRNSVGTVRA